MASIFRSVQQPVQHEVPLQNLGPLCELDTTGTERMDLIITYSCLPPTLADVTVAHPSPSHLPMSSASQMYTPLYFAKKAEAQKYSRYLATARAMNHLFHPYALETFGSCGPMLDNTLKALADRFRNMTTLVSNSEVSEKPQLVRFWRVKISQLCKEKIQS